MASKTCGFLFMRSKNIFNMHKTLIKKKAKQSYNLISLK